MNTEFNFQLRITEAAFAGLSTEQLHYIYRSLGGMIEERENAYAVTQAALEQFVYRAKTFTKQYVLKHDALSQGGYVSNYECSVQQWRNLTRKLLGTTSRTYYPKVIYHNLGFFQDNVPNDNDIYFSIVSEGIWTIDQGPASDTISFSMILDLGDHGIKLVNDNVVDTLNAMKEKRISA